MTKNMVWGAAIALLLLIWVPALAHSAEPSKAQVKRALILSATALYPQAEEVRVSCDPSYTKPTWWSHDCFITYDGVVSPRYKFSVQRRKCWERTVRGWWHQHPMTKTRCMKMWLAENVVIPAGGPGPLPPATEGNRWDCTSREQGRFVTSTCIEVPA